MDPMTIVTLGSKIIEILKNLRALGGDAKQKADELEGEIHKLLVMVSASASANASAVVAGSSSEINITKKCGERQALADADIILNPSTGQQVTLYCNYLLNDSKECDVPIESSRLKGKRCIHLRKTTEEAWDDYYKRMNNS